MLLERSNHGETHRKLTEKHRGLQAMVTACVAAPVAGDGQYLLGGGTWWCRRVMVVGFKVHESRWSLMEVKAICSGFYKTLSSLSPKYGQYPCTKLIQTYTNF